jgi:hypothetical protein
MNEKELKELQEKAAKADTLEKELATLKAMATAKVETKAEDKKVDTKQDDTDLNDKVLAEKKDKEQRTLETKKLEGAMTFNLQSDKFIKEHESILPKDMTDIFKAADKEKYDSQIEKAAAIKSALIYSFFKVQANLDSLTASQKSAIEDYEKLTKRGREEKAEEIFTNIFEPSLAMIKQIKKAEEIVKTKNGLGDLSDGEKRYADRMTKYSQNHYGIKDINHGT